MKRRRKVVPDSGNKLSNDNLGTTNGINMGVEARPYHAQYYGHLEFRSEEELHIQLHITPIRKVHK